MTDSNCDDTYYGCVDWTTGKFEMEIPDDCCPELVTCDVMDCWDSGSVPTYIYILFNGVRRCVDNSLIEELNVCHCATLAGECTGVDANYLGGIQDVDFDGTTFDLCIGVGLQPLGNSPITVFRVADGETCNNENEDGFIFLNSDDEPPCPPKTYDNDFAIGNCNATIRGYGGTATLIDVSGALPASAWADLTVYALNDMVIGSDGKTYVCIQAHTSSLSDKPITGGNWESYWRLTDC